MRISDALMQTGGGEAIRKVQEPRKAEGSKGGAAEKVTRKDSVQVSSAAQELGATEAQVKTVKAHASAAPEVREDRIAEVKERIQSGYYTSPEFNEKLADSLIRDMFQGG